MAPSGRASNSALRFRRFAAWKSGEALRASSRALAAFGPLARKAMSLSALTAAGQASFVIALPLLSRLYTPSDFGLFTIYLSIVNIGGPLVGLKLESALYTVRTKEEAGVSLVLSLVTIIVMTSVAAVALIVFAGHFAFPANASARWVAWLLPPGLLLAGLWSASSAWAIRSEAIYTLGTARFIQPAAMTGLQLAAGLAMPSGVALIGAHLPSHLGYSTFLLWMTVNRKDLSTLSPVRWSIVANHAKSTAAFPCTRCRLRSVIWRSSTCRP